MSIPRTGLSLRHGTFSGLPRRMLSQVSLFSSSPHGRGLSQSTHGSVLTFSTRGTTFLRAHTPPFFRSSTHRGHSFSARTQDPVLPTRTRAARHDVLPIKKRARAGSFSCALSFFFLFRFFGLCFRNSAVCSTGNAGAVLFSARFSCSHTSACRGSHYWV